MDEGGMCCCCCCCGVLMFVGLMFVEGVIDNIFGEGQFFVLVDCDVEGVGIYDGVGKEYYDGKFVFVCCCCCCCGGFGVGVVFVVGV